MHIAIMQDLPQIKDVSLWPGYNLFLAKKMQQAISRTSSATNTMMENKALDWQRFAEFPSHSVFFKTVSTHLNSDKLPVVQEQGFKSSLMEWETTIISWVLQLYHKLLRSFKYNTQEVSFQPRFLLFPAWTGILGWKKFFRVLWQNEKLNLF